MRLGMEASGHARWFERLMRDLQRATCKTSSSIAHSMAKSPELAFCAFYQGG